MTEDPTFHRPQLAPPSDSNTSPAKWMEMGRLAELGMLSAEIIHELRQPVFSSRSLVDLMRRADPENAELEMLGKQLRHMQDLLERYAVSGRRSRGLAEPLDLLSTIQNTAETMRARARSRQRRLKFHKKGPARAILADPVGVRQIAINLIGNALDAARSVVTVSVEGGRLTVRDDGPGVPLEHRARIFDPFFSTKPPEQGTGLGLAIARQLAEESGAVLEWDSTVSGTEFRVHFPLLGGQPSSSSGQP